MLFSDEAAERQILTPTAAAVFRVQWKDERAKLANLFAAVTGMRQGEILALRFQDLGPDCLYVQHGWNRIDALKPPKNNETRTVELPFPELLQGLLEQAKQNLWDASPESFVFWSDRKADRPMKGELFLDGLRDALVKTGMGKESAAGYVYHSWRHFFCSYMMGKVEKKLLKSQSGHKTDVMLLHYGEHRIDGDREQIRAAERETFGRLIPVKVDYIQVGGA
jgi:integrase